MRRTYFFNFANCDPLNTPNSKLSASFTDLSNFACRGKAPPTSNLHFSALSQNNQHILENCSTVQGT